MCARLRPLVQVWWEGLRNPLFPPHNGFYDNGIPGVNALNEFAPAPAPNNFYFTMSFDASEDFPNARLSVADFATFPSPLNLLNIPGTLAAISLNVFISYVPGAPTLVNLEVGCSSCQHPPRCLRLLQQNPPTRAESSSSRHAANYAPEGLRHGRF
jgi:hypothetical protein